VSPRRWKLTVRHGSEVSTESFDDLDEAVAAMRERALAIRSEGPLRAVRSLRDFEPGDQVHARLQLSSGGLLRKSAAGVDVRGDGTFVPFKGGVVREELDPTHHETPFDLVRETLGGEARGPKPRPRSQRAATPPASE
jgi:hypothetical protein